MCVRAYTHGLRLVIVPPSSRPLRNLDTPITFAAMTPMQVFETLHHPEEKARLSHIRQLIIGGGAISDNLSDELRDFPHAVWSTYGMTETLSHIALRRLNGPERSEWYVPFDGVSLSQDADGCLVIDAPAVHDGQLKTNDIVCFQQAQRLFKILGRKDNVICSGGVKIQIEEVERLLRPHLSAPYIITRAKDEKFGEIVVLLTEGGDTDQTMDLCRRVLPKYWVPRRIVTVPHIPMTETGKPARAEAERLAVQP